MGFMGAGCWRGRVLGVLAGSAVLAGCASPTPDFPALRPGLLNQTAALEIEPRHQTEIGPSSDPFTLQIQNRGSAPVGFVLRGRDGEETGERALESGAFAKPRVPSGSTVVLRNPARLLSAELIVRVDSAQAVPVRMVVND